MTISVVHMKVFNRRLKKWIRSRAVTSMPSTTSLIAKLEKFAFFSEKVHFCWHLLSLHNGTASVEGGEFLVHCLSRWCMGWAELERAVLLRVLHSVLHLCHSGVTLGNVAQVGTSSLQLCRGSSWDLSCQLVVPMLVLTSDFYLYDQNRGKYIWNET